MYRYRSYIKTIFIILLSLLIIIGCSNNNAVQGNSANTSGTIEQKNQIQTKPVIPEKKPITDAGQTTINNATSKPSGELKVHFLDVGQADCILIQTPSGKNMLIDAGNNADAGTITSYLDSQGVKKIDVLVGTHPHEDHIGSLDMVIKDYEIGKIYMPKVITTTKTFEDVLLAAKSKGLTINVAKAGVSIDLGSDVKAEILAPNGSSYEDLNNYSAVIKLTFGNTKFLFTGDASAQSEQEMLNKGYDLKSDVLKVGHHGSSSATTSEFLKAVNPKYAVISCGKNNDYGHPHKETMEKLKSMEITVYRTDECGTIVATSDGKNISFNVKPGNYNYGSAGNEDHNNTSTVGVSGSNRSEKVYVDANGKGLIKGNINSKGEKIYHLPGDPWYDRTEAEVWFKTESEAKAAGFRPPKR
jgi:beta-lactamase superfamily II metal-dependent hydrolase